jgi:flagellar biosynthesis/type III secretory pathway protein FliH
VEQGALTNWQLSTLVGQYADAQLQAVAAYQEQLESAFMEGYDEGTLAADELNEALSFGQSLATFDTAPYRTIP